MPLAAEEKQERRNHFSSKEEELYGKLKLEIPVSLLVNKTLMLSLRLDPHGGSNKVEFETKEFRSSMHVPLRMPDSLNFDDVSTSSSEFDQHNQLLLDLDFFNKSSVFIQNVSSMATPIPLSDKVDVMLLDTADNLPVETTSSISSGINFDSFEADDLRDNSLESFEKMVNSLNKQDIVAQILPTIIPINSDEGTPPEIT